MESSHRIAPISPPTEKGSFVWMGLLLAVVVGPLFGLVWAWFAHVVEGYVAPLLLFPTLLGIFAGLSAVALARFAQLGHRPTIVLAAVLIAAVAVLGQHGFAYLAAYDSHHAAGVSRQDLSAAVRQMRPSFGEYMIAQAKVGRPLGTGFTARGWLVWLSWAIDALLLIGAAIVVTIPAIRVPYCNRCGTWYRTIRSGKVDSSTMLRLAELLGVEGIGQPRSPRFRLSACHNGCSPTRCELSWEDADNAVEQVQAWLDPNARNQVVMVLDSLKSRSASAPTAAEE